MSKDNPPPIEITNALAALDVVRAENPQGDFSALSKTLPPLARRLAHNDLDISVEALAAHARAGADHVRDLYASLDGPQKNKRQKTYDEIIASYPTTPPQNRQQFLEAGNTEEYLAAIAGDNRSPAFAAVDVFTAIRLGHTDLALALIKKDAGKSMMMTPADLLKEAAGFNQIETFRAIAAAYKTPVNLCSAVAAAAKNNHSDMLQILFNDYNAHEHSVAIKSAAENDHADLVRTIFDLMKKAKKEIYIGLAMGAATESKGINTIRMLINEYDAYDPQTFRNLLTLAADHGNSTLVRMLVQEFNADVHAKDADGNLALQAAMWNEQFETACMLVDDFGADDSILDDSGRDMLRQTRLWLDAHDFSNPNLCGKNPALVKRTTFFDVQDMFKSESHSSIPPWPYIYSTAATFGTTDRVLRYLEQWGKPGNQPLHDIIQMIKIPTQDQIDQHQKPDLKAWGDALLQCGPKMAYLVKFSHFLPTPEKDASGRFWSYDRTIEALSTHTEFTRNFSPELVEIGLKAFWDDGDFAIAEKTYAAYHDQYTAQGEHKPENAIPAITIAGHHFGKDGFTFHRLPDGDVRGLALGAFTACCQHVGGAGRACAIHGFLSPASGFYVITNDKTDEVVAQSWAWRGESDELVLDSLEYLPSHMNTTQWKNLCTLFAQSANKAGVETIHLGKDGNTPRDLGLQEAKNPARPRDYNGYRDSEEQYVIARPK
ncbi:ankyrin repeat domain-containing protein [Micavibrio aeruginosavorus]|uniref:ankyrin repeat domain-containing protein n=1 Tax=Micavibrio aeruginosavorus TaxID=349221 RepID=UPI003F4AB66D